MISVETKLEKTRLCVSGKELAEVKERINKGRIWKDIAVVLFIVGCANLLYNNIYIKSGSEWYYQQRITFLFVFGGLVSFLISRHYEDRLPADVRLARKLICYGMYKEIVIQNNVLKITFPMNGYIEKLDVYLPVALQEKVQAPFFDLKNMALYLPDRRTGI